MTIDNIIAYLGLIHDKCKWYLIIEGEMMTIDVVYIYLKTFSFNNNMQVNFCELVIINNEKKGWIKNFNVKKWNSNVNNDTYI
jgi:hypothetical protein